MSKSKRNQTFQYLEALAIIMVIDDHMSTRIGILSSVFPYNSFYMPMFVFISGYFYYEQNFIPYLKHKAKHLLFPYLIWSVVGEIIAYMLMKAGIVNWFVNPITFKNIAKLFLLEPYSSITGPSWFAIMLFWVSIFYCFLDELLHLKNVKRDYVFLSVSILLGMSVLMICMKGCHGIMVFIMRTMWYCQFYHMGKMFHKYWEAIIETMRTLVVALLCVLLNVILICFFGDDINFMATSAMGNFHSYWLPLITSITGTLFWYKIARYVSARIGRIPIIDFVAENTFTIMACHVIFINVPNFYAYYQFLSGNTAFSDFPIEAFRANAWVRYSSNTRLLGFFSGLFGSLLVCYLLRSITMISRRGKIAAS
jgi:fucose 4-O-acetylase-like acetyltransferase